MPAPEIIHQLVRRFEDNLPAYRSGHYNETQLRREFLDPFFEALGWDVFNKQGYAEAYKDVVHEDAIKVSGGTRAPDYSFRVGGTRKFFVEAKKPSVNIKDDISPTFQLRRYAWSAKLPLSILTDFEEFAVFDCRSRPDRGDKPAAGRIMMLTFQEYLEKWDEIAAVFSREAVLKGSFDRFAEAATGKRGTAEVDDAFLAEIERWRELLARNIALRNPQLNQRELNYAVQMTIDRIIFLRIAEDRGIEMYGALLALVNGGNLYARLGQLFQQADQRYNSGLFHFRPEKDQVDQPDELTLSLAIDDKPLKDILAHLYYPDSPYEFSVLPADILGQVYEQFLGKVIRLTAGHHAVVEDKPEVKKAGGVFYTPTYIVDYIVRHTVGALLQDKKPADFVKAGGAALRILDPACGSGSFLLGAYQYLLDWYRDGYIADDPLKWAKGARPRLVQTPLSTSEANGEGPGVGWRLTTAERKRILLEHIYGVDIDPQAVEVTKLSLLLKVLEGENEQTIGKQLMLFQERALPDLGQNIQCGNSLIGPDFYQGQQASFLDLEEQLRINAFDWERAFPQVFADGGFDAVIGNPPYIRIQALKEWAPKEVEFYKQRYTAASKGNYDIYVVFVEKGLSLLNERGRLGFILPHKFFNAKYGEPLRQLLSAGKHLSKIVHFGDQQVFENATTYTCLMFLDRSGNSEFEFEKVEKLDFWREAKLYKSSISSNISVTGIVNASDAASANWNFTVGQCAALFEKLSQMKIRLGDVANRIYQGPITGADTVYLFKEFRNITPDITEVFSKELDEWIQLETSILKRVIRSGNIGRYYAKTSALVLFPYLVQAATATLITPRELQKGYPLTWKYLSRNKKLLETREKKSFTDAHWYRFGRTQNLYMWERPKLLIPYMITKLSAYFDLSDNYYFINVTTGGYGITIEEDSINYLYLCGLINSRLLDFFLKHVSTTFHGGYFAANKQFIEQLPIRPIDFTNPADIERHDRMVVLVERMLSLHQKLAATQTPSERTVLQRQVEATDQEIDRLVYVLYGLTEEEIRIVEGGT